MAAQKIADLRRLRSKVEADQKALRTRQAELKDLLTAAPATDWHEAAERAPYLLVSSRRVWVQAICAAAS